MSKTVFILGAGASVPAGAPIMRDFLDKAEDLRRSDTFLDSKTVEAFRAVFAGIAQLQPVFAKSYIDRDNLEAVFVAFEMAKLLGRLGQLEDREEVGRLPGMLVHVIVKTLERTIQYPVRNGTIYPNSTYELLAQYLVEHPGDAAVLTFNYDWALEHALACCSRGTLVDYCLGNGRAGAKLAPIPVLKLHGSLNWFPGQAADEVSVVTIGGLISGRSGSETVTHLDLSTAGGTSPGAAEPIIVPPTVNKGEHRQRLAPVWQAAARELKDAEEIGIIGFSLPPTDEFFRYLFALGTVGESRIRRVVLIDPYASALADRYKQFLGTSLHGKFTVVNSGFETAASKLRSSGLAGVIARKDALEEAYRNRNR